MTAEEYLLDETHAWMTRGRNDLDTAKLLIGLAKYAEVLFFCQQAAEKAFKGFLAFHQQPFRKTHEMRELIAQCLAIDDSLRSALEPAEGLSKYAWLFRYPGAPYEPERAEATSGFETAETAVRAIEQRLPAGV
jgi:HEPN domain-containing protein